MATTVKVQRGDTFAGYNELTTMCCPECAVLYAVPARLVEHARQRGNRERVWYCPNGHELGYTDPPGEPEEAKLRRQLNSANDRAARLVADRDQVQAALRAQKARATRFRNDRDRERKRTAAGVCPCCSRTFRQLARHMQSQHPQFAETENEA